MEFDRTYPTLQGNDQTALTQTAYKKDHVMPECNYITQEAIQNNLQDGRASFLSLYDLEKAFDSLEHCILFQSCTMLVLMAKLGGSSEPVTAI